MVEESISSSQSQPVSEAVADLIAKLEVVKTGSAGLDGYIAAALNLQPEWAVKHKAPGQPELFTDGGAGTRAREWVAPRLTTSVDAILALIEKRRLPWMGPVSLIWAGSGMAHLEHKDPCMKGVQAFGNTPALALCIALLRALSS